MSTTTTPSVRQRSAGAALLVIATGQLMLVLDDTIADIALPSIQRDLAVPATTLSWVINAYILAFGSLLLLGGKLGDRYRRRRILRVGLGHSRALRSWVQPEGPASSVRVTIAHRTQRNEVA
jgi:predicted MFS family arabinose efflux permease